MNQADKDVLRAIELLNEAAAIFNRVGMDWVDEEFLSPCVEAVENWNDEDEGVW